MQTYALKNGRPTQKYLPPMGLFKDRAFVLDGPLAGNLGKHITEKWAIP